MTNGRKRESIDWSMESHACCVRCSDHKSIAQKERDESMGCCQSQCILEKPKTSFTDKCAPRCPQFRRNSEEERQIEIASCYDKFALAKRLHAENLQHQPLPDRVDDSIFKRGHRTCSVSCERIAMRQDKHVKKGAGDYVFAPALGCKEPKTRMDLAICWETPVDPVYEPRKSTHIDGSEGGSAPAIFAMIQHTPVPKSRELLAIRSTKGKNECTCAKRQEDSKRDSCCHNYFRNELGDGPSRGGKLSRSMLRVTERKCAACDDGKSEGRKKDPRLIRSAVDIALDLEHGARTGNDKEPCKGRRLPAKLTVPRPRTPFARRTFCINTLEPPFSVMDGCRDTDYPEHWRLMTVHQQSYRHPQHRKTAFDYKMRIIS